MQHELGEYQDIINRFLDGQLGAAEFESGYLRMFKQDSTIHADAEYEILKELFRAVDAYCDNQAFRLLFSSDEEQLRAEARKALQALASLRGSA